MNIFHCSQCGLCCQHIDRSPLLQEFHSGDGICKFLNRSTNRCTIYEKRPVICNVEASYETYFSNLYTKEDYLRMNYEACARLQKKFYRKKYRIWEDCLMYLAFLSEEQKNLFLDLSIFSMKSDGVIEPRELDVVYQYCGEMGIDQRETTKAKNVDEVLKRLKEISTESELKKITIELVALMYADEDFADEENALLSKLQETFGFTSHLIGEIVFATRHLILSHKMLTTIVK